MGTNDRKNPSDGCFAILGLGLNTDLHPITQGIEQLKKMIEREHAQLAVYETGDLRLRQISTSAAVNMSSHFNEVN